MRLRKPALAPPWLLALAVGQASSLASVVQVGNLPGPLPTLKLSQVQKKPVEWLWPGYVPLGKLTVLDGDPDLGKSTLLLDLAARISTHGVMPDGKQGVCGGVLLLSAEDGVLEDMSILPRLLAAWANVERIEVKNEAGQDRHPPVIPLDLPEIEEDLKRSDARLLLIDTLTAFLAVDTRSDQEVRRALHPLKLIAERCRCAVIYLRHLNKGTSTKAMYRGGGSIAIIGAARAGLLVAKDSDDGRNVLAQTKHNLGPEMPSLTYELVLTEYDVCRIVWTGTSPKRADELLQAPATMAARAEEEEAKSKLELAREWLADFLNEGPRPVKVCHAEAGKVGITKQTLQRAAAVLVGKPKMSEGVWYWSLKENLRARCSGAVGIRAIARRASKGFRICLNCHRSGIPGPGVGEAGRKHQIS